MSNTDHVSLGKNAGYLDISTLYVGYSKVVIIVGQDEDGADIVFEAGDDTGRTLEITNPFGTQAMADNILTKIQGWQYQPYSARDALLDPSAEIGDAVTINKIHSGIYYKGTDYNALAPSDISAPQAEEIEHEVQVLSPTLRNFSRQIKETKASLAITASAIAAEVAARTAADEDIRATLTVQAGEISAKVSKSGGSSSTFGWTLTDSSWTLKSNSRTVLTADSTGITVNGIIQATSGYIGSSSHGFTITSSAIYNNLSSMSGTQTSGVYIGNDGIKLGQNFAVTSGGALTARSGTFGSLNIDSGGRAGGSYHGSLSGCAGSVSGGLSFSGTTLDTVKNNASTALTKASSASSAASAAQTRADDAMAKADNAIKYFNGQVTASNMLISRARIGKLYAGGGWRSWSYSSEAGGYVLK